jgi:two-component system chemotaxis sensor kinase CheA
MASSRRMYAIAAGKDPEGTLKLRAYQEGSHVVIEVSDDGAGIAVEKVRAEGDRAGLITGSRRQLAERELLQLMFLPGFSTAAAVTNVSGRGVGMDVVRTNVEKIGGKVEIDSHAGQGNDAAVAHSTDAGDYSRADCAQREQSFALPQGALSELVHVPPEQADKRKSSGWKARRFTGCAASCCRWCSSIGCWCRAAHTRSATEKDNFIAVLERRRPPVWFGGGWAGRSGRDCGEAALSAVLKSIGLYSGATVLGNADLALILDPGSIAMKAGVTMSAKKSARRGGGGERGRPGPRAWSICW